MTITAATSGRRGRLADAADAIQELFDRRQRSMVAHLHQCNQSPAQLHVLGTLSESGPTTVSRLATRLGISPPSTSAIVDRMVEAGLLVRERSDEDRRTVTVGLAPEGETALQAAVGGRRGMLERVLGQLDDAELADTARVARRLAAALATATGQE